MSQCLAAARASRRRLFVVGTPGLERVLERELQVLRVPGQFEAVPGGIIIDGTTESLWRTALQSRVAESVRLRVGDPFHAPDEKTLVRHLATLPWDQCLWLDGGDARDLPAVRATSSRSRLYHTKLLEDAVLSAVTAARQTSGGGVSKPEVPATAGDATSGLQLNTADEADDASLHGGQAGGASSSSRKYRSQPEVRVQMKYDECQVSVAATDLLHQRGYRKAVGDAPLRETFAAACVLSSPLQRRLTIAQHAGEELALWDPFCGSGGLLLEALGVAMGLHPGAARARSFPFLNFPAHDPAAYEELLREMQPTPHPALGRLRLYGSDISAEQVECARRNLRRFARRAHGVATEDDDANADRGKDDAPPLPCPVSFERGSPAKMAKNVEGRPTMILTNVPYGVRSGTARGDRRQSGMGRSHCGGGSGEGAADAYAQLGRLLRQQKADWRGVFCVAADPEELRAHTALEWTSELRFLNGSRWVELLQWTGQTRPVDQRAHVSAPRPSHGGRRRE